MSYFNISPQKPLLSNEDEKVLKVSHFGGVDYTTSTLKMTNNRAIDSLNYIRKSYVLEKRNGLNDELQIDGVIYDLWHFLDYLVIHWNGNISVYNYSNLSHIKTFENQVRSDTKIMAFESGEKLYILGGIKYLVLYRKKFMFGADNILLEEASKLAYIPTTTIGINQDNYEGETSRSTLDDQNLLVDKVINELIGGSSIKTYYQSSGGEIFDTPQDGSTSFENPNVVNKYILDRAIHVEENIIEENGIKINDLPQINIRYNWKDIIKIILKETDNVESFYEYEVEDISDSLTSQQDTYTFSYKAFFDFAYKDYDLTKLEWTFNGVKQENEHNLTLEQTYTFDIPSYSNSIEKTITANVSYKIGDSETTSASVSKKVKVRKYQQRYYLYVFSKTINNSETEKVFEEVFLLAVANSKIKGKTKFDVQFIVKGNKAQISYSDTDNPLYLFVIADNTELSYGQIKKIFEGEMYYTATSSIYSSYLNDDDTYFLINGKKVKPSITASYLGGSNTDNFYKDFNRRLEGIGVKYDA